MYTLILSPTYHNTRAVYGNVQCNLYFVCNNRPMSCECTQPGCHSISSLRLN